MEAEKLGTEMVPGMQEDRMTYAFGRGKLGHLAMRLPDGLQPPEGFDLEDGKHKQELYAVIAKRNRRETERAIASAQLKAEEVEI